MQADTNYQQVTVKQISCGLDHSLALTDSGQVIFWGFLRRPKAWKDEGYGPAKASAEIVPRFVQGAWSGTGGIPCFISSGESKCFVVVERDSADILNLLSLEGLDMIPADSGGAAVSGNRPDYKALQQENYQLRQKVAELTAQLSKAQAVFSKYLPMFTVDLQLQDS